MKQLLHNLIVSINHGLNFLFFLFTTHGKALTNEYAVNIK